MEIDAVGPTTYQDIRPGKTFVYENALYLATNKRNGEGGCRFSVKLDTGSLETFGDTCSVMPVEYKAVRVK